MMFACNTLQKLHIKTHSLHFIAGTNELIQLILHACILIINIIGFKRQNYNNYYNDRRLWLNYKGYTLTYILIMIMIILNKNPEITPYYNNSN